MSTARPHPRRTAGWAVVALACLLGQVIGVLHMGLVEHQRCAAHGELVEGRGDAAEVVVAVEPGGPAAFYAHAQRGDHDHDHCQAPSERTAPQLGPFAVALQHLRPAAVAPPVARPAIAAQGLFRLAPKASPPAAA